MLGVPGLLLLACPCRGGMTGPAGSAGVCTGLLGLLRPGRTLSEAVPGQTKTAVAPTRTRETTAAKLLPLHTAILAVGFPAAGMVNQCGGKLAGLGGAHDYGVHVALGKHDAGLTDNLGGNLG